jgi:hypothetical protein
VAHGFEQIDGAHHVGGEGGGGFGVGERHQRLGRQVQDDLGRALARASASLAGSRMSPSTECMPSATPASSNSDGTVEGGRA